MENVFFTDGYQLLVRENQRFGVTLTTKTQRSLKVVSQLLRLWWRRWIFREHVAHLNKHLLADIGLEKRQALDEAQKPLWR